VSRTISASAAVLGVSLLLAACGGSSKSSTGKTAAAAPAASTTASQSSTVKTASSSLGTILVDAQGMTLYRLSGESAKNFICTAQACLAIWHPLKASAGAAPTGAASLGTVRRPDGSEQVSYEGAPLYTFASDTAPGQTNGQGLKDVGTWSVVKASGSSSGSAAGAAAPASESSGSSGSGGGGGGYGY
jgi:predicted lipoprotein with Yx(FWY)xxD motif